ncbi:DnaA N-terminal domain-containing protein [Candidatus Paracaedibacter symbiosus]|uniref:DnaA N-terminal domain-containing protein n=1 Tax=Candidatus Paracaedibacter symbiosus TaxID=244582 RepID=UPI00069057F0|nr:DnaA N-terminal domain-containing protein [Candidatus Paracaedibacter symbiosus]
MRPEKTRVLLEQDKCLILQPELVKLIGKSAALLFQQMHYWISSKENIGIVRNGQKWIYNSYESWARDLQTVSKSTINRSIRILRDFDLILVEKLSHHKSNRTNWYTINYKKLEQLLPPPPSKEISPPLSPLSSKGKDQPKTSRPSTQNESFYNTEKTNKKDLINPNTSKNSDEKSSNLNLKKPFTQQMVDIWNDVIQPEVQTGLTKNRCKMMIAALKYKFDNCLQKWKHYCLQIASSDFLMGKINSGFKIGIDGALKFDFIRKIFEKNFGIKNIISPSKKEDMDSILRDIDNSSLSCEVKNLKREILHALGETIYQHWFKDCAIVASSDDKTFTVLAKNRFYRDTIENNYKARLETILKKRTVIIGGERLE